MEAKRPERSAESQVLRHCGPDEEGIEREKVGQKGRRIITRKVRHMQKETEVNGHEVCTSTERQDGFHGNPLSQESFKAPILLHLNYFNHFF